MHTRRALLCSTSTQHRHISNTRIELFSPKATLLLELSTTFFDSPAPKKYSFRACVANLDPVNKPQPLPPLWTIRSFLELVASTIEMVLGVTGCPLSARLGRNPWAGIQPPITSVAASETTSLRTRLPCTAAVSLCSSNRTATALPL